MKIVKNRLRTKVDDERSNSLLTCTLKTLILDEFSNSELAEKWAKNETGRRIQLVCVLFAFKNKF